MRSTIWRECGARVLLYGELGEDLFEGGQGQETAEAFDGVVGDDSAAVQDDDVRAETLDGLQLMRAEEHDLATLGELLNETAEHQRRADVEAGKGLIEEDELRVVQERRDEQHLLAHAL